MKCPNCGAEVEDGMKFCGECGTKIPQEKICPSCGAANPLTTKFCGECGTKLDGTEAAGNGGLSMGDKNVVAGDVTGTKVMGNAVYNITTVAPENQTKELECHICGRHLLSHDSITCKVCGKTVCEHDFDNKYKCCVRCAAPEYEKIKQFENQIAEINRCIDKFGHEVDEDDEDYQDEIRKWPKNAEKLKLAFKTFLENELNGKQVEGKTIQIRRKINAQYVNVCCEKLFYAESGMEFYDWFLADATLGDRPVVSSEEQFSTALEHKQISEIILAKGTYSLSYEAFVFEPEMFSISGESADYADMPVIHMNFLSDENDYRNLDDYSDNGNFNFRIIKNCIFTKDFVAKHSNYFIPGSESQDKKPGYIYFENCFTDQHEELFSFIQKVKVQKRLEDINKRLDGVECSDDSECTLRETVKNCYRDILFAELDGKPINGKTIVLEASAFPVSLYFEYLKDHRTTDPMNFLIHQLTRNNRLYVADTDEWNAAISSCEDFDWIYLKPGTYTIDKKYMTAPLIAIAGESENISEMPVLELDGFTPYGKKYAGFYYCILKEKYLEELAYVAAKDNFESIKNIWLVNCYTEKHQHSGEYYYEVLEKIKQEEEKRRQEEEKRQEEERKRQKEEEKKRQKEEERRQEEERKRLAEEKRLNIRRSRNPEAAAEIKQLLPKQRDFFEKYGESPKITRKTLAAIESLRYDFSVIKRIDAAFAEIPEYDECAALNTKLNEIIKKKEKESLEKEKKAQEKIENIKSLIIKILFLGILIGMFGIPFFYMFFLNE